MVGLDVSKATVACTLVNPATRQTEWEQTLPNNTTGVQHLLSISPPGVPWVLEPTGRFSATVAAQARAAGRTVLLAPPREAKAFLRAVQGRAKTDRLDSRGLALYALAVPLRPYPLKNPLREQIDQLLAARRLLSRSLASLRQQQTELPHAAAALGPAIKSLEAQRKVLDRQLAQLTGAQGLPGVQALLQVPGIGPVTAITVAACLAGGGFRHPDQFVAYAGLDVRVRDSGQRKGQRALTKQGDAELRRLLYLAALASLRSKDRTFEARYRRELAKGLSTTGAVCTVARKLARVCWSLVRHGATYQPERVDRQGEAPHVLSTRPTS